MTTATIPNFGTIAVANMAKPKNYNSTSKEVLALQAAYDNFLKGVKPGQAGVIQAGPDAGVKSIRMNLRYASVRTGIKIEKTVVADDPERIEFTVSAPASNGAAPSA